jgi:hypothetical protein
MGVVRAKAAGDEGTGVIAGAGMEDNMAICCLKYPKMAGTDKSPAPAPDPDPPPLLEDPISLAIVSAYGLQKSIGE